MHAPIGPPPLHDDCAPLAFLLGTWRGAGTGEYPTIDDFAYTEEALFGHVGKPFLTYVQRTRDVDGAPLHAESGYLRAVGAGRVELIVAQPSGIVEIHQGTVRTTAGGGRIELRSVHVAGSPTAKEVSAVHRDLEVAGDVLGYTLDMAAVGRPLGHHLTAELYRSTP